MQFSFLKSFGALLSLMLLAGFALSLPVLTQKQALAQEDAATPKEQQFDVIIRGGTVYDGTGSPGVTADVALRGDTIVAIGDLQSAQAETVIDATGLAVAPGFINVLSWGFDSLLSDGRGMSDVKQGVTLEIFGEGSSPGPVNPRTQRQSQGSKRPWVTLIEALEHLAEKGVSPNVASFVGATTVRIHELGYEDRAPTAEELERMKELVRTEMAAGALGLGTSLIYAPAFYAKTEELVELSKVAAEYDGIYISHLRSEGNRWVEAIDELLTIAREANIAAEVYHIKAAGAENWPKRAEVIAKIEQARAEGLRISANVYPYAAASTGLNASMPPWVQEGGYSRWADRLRDDRTRERVIEEMRTPSDEWENFLLLAGSAENVLLVNFQNRDLRHLTGKTLAEVAQQRGLSPEEAAIQLVIEDGSRVGCVYFVMNEEDVKANISLPWTSFGSDGGVWAAEGSSLEIQPHPRAYGTFARLLGKYVRDEKVVTLEQAVHKLTGLPATNLGLRKRGFLRPDYFADIVIFDPATIQDHATYDQPHQYATGVKHVLINGQAVIRDGEHTGAKPGRVVYGPGKYLKKYDAPPVVVTEEALRVHREGYVFDGHNDLPWEIRERGRTFEKIDISKPQPKLNTDIERLKQGNLGAQYWSVYVPAGTDRTGEALQTTLEQIAIVEDMLRRYPETFEKALTAADVQRIRSEGKVASLIGLEGGHSIENSIGTLRQLFDLGARYMTLTHSDSLDWADSATDSPVSNGLSAFGVEVVCEMNRLGMLVDLSHVSDDVMRQVLEISKAPVMFSHSSARSVANHPRNVPDDVLVKLAENRGIVMANFFSAFVDPDAADLMRELLRITPELRAKYPDDKEYRQARSDWYRRNPIPSGNVYHVVDHIDHLVRVAGIDHVGIGSDYDGVSNMLPKQLEDVSTYPVITQELLNRGYTPAEIHKIMHGNMLRVMREAEAVAAELQATGSKENP